ncbi:MAG: hypothetical protein AAGB31_14010 [Bdellovibrio sp.]
MANKKIVGISATVVVLGTVLVTMGNGCSGQFGAFEVLPGLADQGSNSATDTGSLDSEVIPGAKTVSLVYANQILDQLTSCAGVLSPSDSTVKMFEEKKGAVSTYGTADSVNPAMMMAVISIAGEVCNDLINQEIQSGGRIFKDMNLSGNALPADGVLRGAISRLALSCWNRHEENDEQTAMLDMIYNSIGNSENGAGRKSALMVCTSMLSSLDSLLN